MIEEPVVQQIAGALFPQEGPGAFAVVDGASIPRLLESLYAHRPDYFSLFVGDLTPDVAAAAPYLVELRPNEPFTTWLISEGWGNHWGIFALSGENSRVLRNHFRSLLSAQSPEGKPAMFRFYDPRVLREYLPKCGAERAREIFGPVSAFLLEAKDEKLLLRLTPGAEGAVREEVLVKAAQA